MPEANTSMHPADYVMFALMLVASAAVGFIFGRRKKVDRTSKALITANSGMPLIPTALSLVNSFVSGVSFLGSPSELYLRGLDMWWFCTIGVVLAAFVVIPILLPIYRNNDFLSINAYMEERFGSKGLRYLMAFQFVVMNVLYNGVVIYAPANALSALIDVDSSIFIVLVGVICISYSAFGGIKAVIWTDALQGIIMLVGTTVLVVKGTVDAGGAAAVFSFGKNASRYALFDDITWSPLSYHSLLFTTLGSVCHWTAMTGITQVSVQRYMCLSSLRDGQKVAAFNVVGFIIFFALTNIVGLIMLKLYQSCDPLSAGIVENRDQLVMLFCLDVLRNWPGFPGLFIAALFSATLGNFSSGINSSAALLLEDIAKQWHPRMSQRTQYHFMLWSGVAVGVCTIGVALAVGAIGGVIKAILMFQGLVYGRTTGLFLVGMLFKRVNRFGIYTGFFMSLFPLLFLIAGDLVFNPYGLWAEPLQVDACEAVYNITNATEKFSTTPKMLQGWKQIFYATSYSYGIIGFVFVLVPALFVSSLVTDSKKPTGQKLAHLMAFYKPMQGESSEFELLEKFNVDGEDSEPAEYAPQTDEQRPTRFY